MESSRNEAERPLDADHFREIQLEVIDALGSDEPWDEGVKTALWELFNWPLWRWPRPEPGEEPRSVAIVGKAWESVLAPWGVEGWELWGLNHSEGYMPIEAFTRWFQLHPPRYLGRYARDSLQDLQEAWTRPRGVRLYMERAYEKYPDSEPYPKEEVETLVHHGRYHTSSFDWMMALAVLEGFEEISLFACEFYTPPPYNGEPISSRAALEYWSGVAEGRGAKVEVVSYGSDLFKTIHMARLRSTIQYGFGPEPALALGGGWKDLR